MLYPLKKEQNYTITLKQVKELVKGESDIIANLANICALLKTNFDFFWVGFYLVKKDELILGPFQGPVACTRIPKGKGVCGTVMETAKAMIVDDVHAIKNYISCNSASLSEIVVPVLHNNSVIMVLDIDSNKQHDFSEVDAKYLQEIATVISICNR